jgi:adenosylcobinamide amidohydrolase
MRPTASTRDEDGRAVPVLFWRLDPPLLAISSAPLGGGIGERRWVLNATVPMSYARNDPDAHLLELARGLGLDGPGIGLLTGVDVTDRVRHADGGAVAWATVGLSASILAAAPAQAEAAPAGPAEAAPAGPAEAAPAEVGTINIVASVPARLSDAALVNAVATVTEAKAQALIELGLAATGTMTDAVCVLCPTGGPAEPYGGPRSTWGARLARAVHGAVRAGGAAYLAGGIPWSERPG